MSDFMQVVWHFICVLIYDSWYYIIYGLLVLVGIIIGRKIARNKIAENLEPLEHNDEFGKRNRIYTPNESEEERIVNNIKIKDPGFEKELFEKFVKDVFNRFEEAFTDNELNRVRKFVDVNIMERYKMIIAQRKACNQKQYVKIVDYNFVDFFGYQFEGKHEIVSVAVGTIMYDYVKDEEGNIVEGSDKNKVKRTYLLSFARKQGGQTINNIKDYTEEISHCPNCGAEIKNAYSECEHCGTVLFNSTENWLINHIEIM